MNTVTPYHIIITKNNKLQKTKMISLFLEVEGYPREIPEGVLIIGTVPLSRRNGFFSLSTMDLLLEIFRMFPPTPPEILFLDAFLTQTVRNRALKQHLKNAAKNILEQCSEVNIVQLPSLEFLDIFGVAIGYRIMERLLFDGDYAFQSVLDDIDRLIKEHELPLCDA